MTRVATELPARSPDRAGPGTGADVEAGLGAGLGPGAEPGVDAGTYEVLRARLAGQGAEVARRAEALNAGRLELFGGAELRLTGTERLRTANHCVPRDIVGVGGLMLFGYNVFIGLKPETTVADVFALHRFVRAGDTFRFEEVDPAQAPGLLDDERFARDFAELYRYYRDTRLLQLRRLDGRLLAVFQTGPRPADVRVLRWRLASDGTVSYLDNVGERDHVFPPSHDFRWTPTTRDNHVAGRYPHVSVQGEVFVETIGGHLTLKVENNTETGAGIYSEPVDEPLQSLADADIEHARVGSLILLRVRPYKETAWRHLVYNLRTAEVVRLDGIGAACQRLPDGQGIIFPGGYYLATGVAKTFDTDATGLEFERMVRSPNGEDVLYVFHARAEGRTLLLPYNMIREEVATPLVCHGYSLFDDGTLVVFRALSDEPARVHPMQVWQTPYVSELHAAARADGPDGSGGPLVRVGNAELVRAISDCLSLTRMIDDVAPSSAMLEGLVAACTRVLDRHHWLGEPGLGELRGPLTEVRATADLVLAEFEKVRERTASAAAALDEAAARIASLVRRVRGEMPTATAGWVAQLAELRQARGHLATLRELRYIDTGRIDELAAGVDGETAATALRAVEFLRRPDAFAAHEAETAGLDAAARAATTVAATAPVQERLTALVEELRTVAEVVSGLDLADATVRTAILERAGAALGALNRVRAAVEARRRELGAGEDRAAFAAEFALLGQAVTGALAVADTPERCDAQLGALLLQVEQLESRFGAWDDFLAQLATRRSEVYDAFSARKQGLLDERTRRADRLVDSAGRILATVGRRVTALASLDEVNTYFATDPLVTRLRGVVDELRALGDPVRAEELDGRLKAARQEAGRALRDRLDLYDAGGATIRLGRHRFAVNTEPIDLTLVPSGDGLGFAITGTDYRAPVTDTGFAGTRRFWDRPLVSESPEIYRAEYLAGSLLLAAGAAGLAGGAAGAAGLAGGAAGAAGLAGGAAGAAGLAGGAAGAAGLAGGAAGAGPGGAGAAIAALREAADAGELGEVVRRAAESRYDEGYERGVHDCDAAAVLAALLPLHAGAGLLRYPPEVRAAAQLFWAYGVGDADRSAWRRRAASLARARAEFGAGAAVAELAAELAEEAGGFSRATGLPVCPDLTLVGEYLVEEVSGGPDGCVTGAGARALLARFAAALGERRAAFADDLRALGGDLAARHQVAGAWLGPFAAAGPDPDAADLAEAVAIAVGGAAVPRYDSAAALCTTVDGLVGTHPRVRDGRLVVRLDEFLARVRRFAAVEVPAYRAYQRRRAELVAAERRRLRIEEYRPRVLNGFVRNRLLDEVYLPLIGDNLARQLGATGAGRRTDQMGLLLLISPPGYGKTTLLEYVASRLGLVFVKVDGPALGRGVTSLDPAEAPDATARQEVEKLSFALELGNNVLLYLDDIQHVAPELLQKFIPLCDGSRRMEGVWNGRSRTYDLRGKRFAVCLAGNPYTGSGERFRVPDMLANRADVWNLGDVLAGRDDVFALSFIENALTSNPVLAPLSTRERGDVELLVRLAAADPAVRPDELAHPYSAAELAELRAVLAHLLRVRDVVLAVNRAYIASAAQGDAARTEPPFQLQGSYRDMNKLAERIVPALNAAELEAVIDDHYLAEAQTLTSGAEANLLTLAELRGRLTPAQAGRWAAVKAAFVRAAALGGSVDDPVGRAVGAVGLLADRVGAVEAAIRDSRDGLR